MKPIIGITSCSRLDDYLAAVEQSGGRPRVLEVGESPRAVIERIHGLLLTGGGDVDPVFYGADRHESVEDAEPGRDEFELDLARRAMDADLPTLAICRGAQVLNVSAGGTLVQDVPSALAAALPHHVAEPRDGIAHAIQVAAGSALERALGPAVGPARSCRVNSRHHQAVAALGRNLVATATAPDGVIEAVESPGARFCVGVQWHPENFWKTGEFKPLFDAFVEAAAGRLPSDSPDD